MAFQTPAASSCSWARPINAATVPVFIDQARGHLEQLMIGAPAPAHDNESNTTRLRTLRASSARGARSARPPTDEK